MHVHIAASHGREVQAGGQLQALLHVARIVLATMQLHRQPQAFGEGVAQPLDIGLGVGVCGDPQRQQAGQRLVEVLSQQAIAALFSATPGQGDQATQLLVAAEIFHQQHHFRAVVDAHLAADNQRQLHRFCRLPRPHNARQGAFIGDRQGAVALVLGPFEQLQRRGCTALEAEIRQAMQLGVTHANQPCSHSPSFWPTVR